jgi:hypothetical protein
MRKFFLFFIILTIVLAGRSFAQDTLPKISVKNINNQIIISWKNSYGAKISNINIQRSYDSIKKFTTIGTVLNPLNKENGFVDRKAINPNMFYRIFVAFEGGTYIFSRSHKPVIDTTHTEIVQPTLTVIVEEDLLPATKNTVKPIVPVGFIPSKFIYTNKDNNLIINLPYAGKEKFSLRFFDDKDRPIFEIKKIAEPYLIVEKVNFLHTGWFYYHLYNDGILLEKYKFYIGKDGRVGPPPPETKKSTTSAEN